MGVESRRRKREKCLPLLAGTESVREWVGRVAEQAKQAHGMSSVGVRVGKVAEGERGGVNPKWQSGSVRVGVDGEYMRVSVCILYDRAV